MLTPAQRIAPAQIGVLTVCLLTLALGLLLAAWTYWIGDTDPGYGRNMVVQFALLATLGMVICNLAAFLLTLPLYFWLKLPRERKRMVIHSMVSTLLCTASLYIGAPAWLLEPFKDLTGQNEVGLLFVATILVFIIPFAGSLLAQALWLRGWKGVIETCR